MASMKRSTDFYSWLSKTIHVFTVGLILLVSTPSVPSYATTIVSFNITDPSFPVLSGMFSIDFDNNFQITSLMVDYNNLSFTTNDIVSSTDTAIFLTDNFSLFTLPPFTQWVPSGGDLENTYRGTNCIGICADIVAKYVPKSLGTIPEPSTILLFGSGLAGLAAWRYRKIVSREKKEEVRI